ncbi:VOC family protein [Skermania sp. ID1734]|uniref:VOC family protein n=1 Tax=Skermania sp. ID1734 TaxID=2597516 RepID=UPI00117DB0D3|nr:VOC family protein [Skermania sp. ID1734]TSD94106.1 VOC family protein [Skermania sp. ID1734]
MDATLLNFKLVVSDLERSLTYYRIFGLKEAARVEFTNPDVTEVILENRDGARPLVLIQSDIMPVPSITAGWTPLVFNVDDLAEALATVAAAGFESAIEPLDLGALKIGMTSDPDGYLSEIIEGDTQALEGIPVGQKIPHPIPQIHDRK